MSEPYAEGPEGRASRRRAKKSPPDWISELYEAYASARAGLHDVPEDEINDAINAGVAEVRARRVQDPRTR